MMLKKVGVLVCCICFLFSMLTPLVQAQSVAPTSYGLDNLNNEPGELKIAFLGGSITAGYGAQPQYEKRYSTQVVNRYFKEKYPNKTVTEINAGVDGTPSSLGLYRVNREISDQAPDVVFVEFAVNDHYLANWKNNGRIEVGPVEWMEGIVRQLAALPKQPVVIFLYTHSYDGWLSESIAMHQQVANHYGIGSINLHEYVENSIAGGAVTWHPDTGNWTNSNPASGSWTIDGTHPNNAGYTAYANHIMDLFEEDPDAYFKKLTWKEDMISEYAYGKPYSIPHNSNRITYTGSGWATIDPSAMDENISRRLKHGVHYTRTPGDSFSMSFTGRSFGLFAFSDSTGAVLDYVVDEGTAREIKGAVSTTSAGVTDFPGQTMLIDDLPLGDHTIKCTVRNQAGYTYLSVGYVLLDETDPEPVVKSVTLDKTGTIEKDTKLTGTYHFIRAAKEEGNSTYQWLTGNSATGDFTPINGATALTYTAQDTDAGKYLKLQVTPVNTLGVSGTPRSSEAVYVESDELMARVSSLSKLDGYNVSFGQGFDTNQKGAVAYGVETEAKSGTNYPVTVYEFSALDQLPKGANPALLHSSYTVKGEGKGTAFTSAITGDTNKFLRLSIVPNQQEVTPSVVMKDFGVAGKTSVFETRVRVNSPSGVTNTTTLAELMFGFDLKGLTVDGEAQGTFDTVSLVELKPNGVFIKGENLAFAPFSANVWYTIRTTMNLDTKKYQVQVYDVNDQLLATSAETSILSKLPSNRVWDTTIFHQNGAQLRVAPVDGLSVDWDDIVFAVEDLDVTVQVGEHGSVTPAGPLTVPSGGEAEFEITAEEGYELDSVTVNGQPVEVTNQVLRLQNILVDSVVSVQFREIAATQPEMAATGDVIVDSYQGNPSARWYATVKPNYGWAIIEQGMELRNALGQKIMLPVQNVTAEYQFGLRIYGAALLPGETYTLVPYVTATRDGETVTNYGTSANFLFQ